MTRTSRSRNRDVLNLRIVFEVSVGITLSIYEDIFFPNSFLLNICSVEVDLFIVSAFILRAASRGSIEAAFIQIIMPFLNPFFHITVGDLLTFFPQQVLRWLYLSYLFAIPILPSVSDWSTALQHALFSFVVLLCTHHTFLFGISLVRPFPLALFRVRFRLNYWTTLRFSILSKHFSFFSSELLFVCWYRLVRNLYACCATFPRKYSL